MTVSPADRDEVTFFTEKAERTTSLTCASHIPQTIPETCTVVLIICSLPPKGQDCLWQEPAIGQHPQLQPQEDFPCLFSFRIRITIIVTRAISAMLTIIVPTFSPIH
jgi:hypothetical protein